MPGELIAGCYSGRRLSGHDVHAAQRRPVLQVSVNYNYVNLVIIALITYTTKQKKQKRWGANCYYHVWNIINNCYAPALCDHKTWNVYFLYSRTTLLVCGHIKTNCHCMHLTNDFVLLSVFVVYVLNLLQKCMVDMQDWNICSFIRIFANMDTHTYKSIYRMCIVYIQHTSISIWTYYHCQVRYTKQKHVYTWTRVTP